MAVVQPIELASAHEAALRLAGRPGLCWLDGDAPHAAGGVSFLASDPVQWVRAGAGDPDPLARLSALTAGQPATEPDPRTHAAPRWVGHVAYDAFFGERPRRHPPAAGPALAFARHDAVLGIDHASGEAWLVGDDADACARLARRLAAPPGHPLARVGELSATAPERHRRAIARALEHIAAGDMYQVNLARRFEAGFDGDPLALFVAMRAQGAVPFGFYQRDGDRALCSRTMERFLRFEAATGRLETWPIKGTIARPAGAAGDAAAVLRADPKERAEHAMIVDLMRNDLGRVSRFGTVEVSDVMRVEPFAGLSHLVSTVRGQARPGLGLPELLGATFPPGSVTGTPKLRAIEIIEALEPAARGAYTGAVGHLSRRGDLSLSVAIRTASVAGARVEYWAGGGIVEASDPERELAETELKARVFVDAVAALEAAPAEPLRLPNPPPLLY